MPVYGMDGKTETRTVTPATMAWSCCCLQRISATSIQALLLGVLVLALICVSIVLEAFNRPVWEHNQEDHLYHLAIVNLVNNRSILWKAEYNRFASRALTTSVSAGHSTARAASIRALNAAYSRAFGAEIIQTSIDHWNTVLANDMQVPKQFDARQAWPHCWTMHHVSDQAGCGSCWAMSSVSSMSDRICILSNGTTQPLISAQDVIECCNYCGGCMGNFLPIGPFLYWKEEGLVSGGNYGSMDGCKPYALRPDCGRPCPVTKYLSATSPQCTKACQPLHFPQRYELNKYFGEKAYWLDHSGTAPPDVHNYMQPEKFANVQNGMHELDVQLVSIIKGRKIELLQKELMINGPFTSCFPVTEDLQHYKSGIYNYTTGAIMYSHCVKILGWGEENGYPYWTATNTWGRTWGENGFFRILRGNSETQSISLHVYGHDHKTDDVPGAIRSREEHGEDIFSAIPRI